MKVARLAPLFVLALTVGCVQPPPRPDLTFNHFHAPGFVWRGVARVLLLPVFNETPHPQVPDEMRRSLHAEFQQLGLFEVVPAPPDVSARLAKKVRESGRFDEGEVVELARCGAADVIVLATVSHYSPYLRPRIGLTLQAVSPDMGQVCASVDGLWDANNLSIADRARAYYRRVKSAQEHVCDHLLGKWDDSFGVDLVLTSPHLFQRYVASEAVRLLVNDLSLLDKFKPPVKKCYQPKPMFTLGPLCGKPCKDAKGCAPATPTPTTTPTKSEHSPPRRLPPPMEAKSDAP